MTEFVMEWDDWIELTDAEQEAVRRRYERPGSEALPGSLSVEEQRAWLADTRPVRGGKVCGYHDGCPPDGPVCHLCEHLQPHSESK